MNVSRYRVGIGFLGIELFFVLWLTSGLHIALLYTFYALFIMCLLEHATENFQMIVFLVAFFVFLLGRIFVTQIFDFQEKDYVPRLNQDSIVQMCWLLFLSLASIALGYVSRSRFRFGNSRLTHTIGRDADPDYIITVQRITKILFCICELALIATSVERVIYNYAVGYFTSYLSYSSRLPGVINLLADIEPVIMSLYFATLPSKKDMKIPMCFFLVSMGAYAVGGIRTGLVNGFLLILTYSFMRNRIDEEKWIGKKTIILLCILGPVFIIILDMMSTWRQGISTISIQQNPIFNFLYNIGGSGYLVGYADMRYEDLASRHAFYSLGRIWKFIVGNPVSEAIFSVPVYDNQTVQNALYGHSFGDSITYMMRSNAYTMGYGMGSCYIAELYVDFSYFGVIIGNFIIGSLLRAQRLLEKENITHNYISILFLFLVIRMPRDTFDYVIMPFIGVKNVITLILIHLVAGSLVKRRRKIVA